MFHSYIYRLQAKLQKGSVFTSVCQEFCPQGEVYTPLGTFPPGRWLLQQLVCILLECILVYDNMLKNPQSYEKAIAIFWYADKIEPPGIFWDDMEVGWNLYFIMYVW